MRKKQITMDDVARLANVSKPTVSRALSGNPNVTEQTREKVLAVAREHGYAVNRNARKLREKHTNTVAVVLDFSSHRRDRISDPFIYELLAGVSEALSVRNQDLLLSPPTLTNVDSYRDLVMSRVVDGFIMLGQGANDALFSELHELNVPLVVWGGKTDDTEYCTVGSDNFLGGYLAGERFVTNKCKDVLYVGNSEHLELRLRRDGLRKALNTAHYDIKFRELEIEDFSFSSHFESMARLLKKSSAPDAIFTYSDTAGMAVINALNEHGLEPIKDYFLIGYNDIAQASHFSPRLTTIRQDTFLAGSLLVEKFMSVLNKNNPTSSTIPTELIVRGT
ncbi:LacI family DNA-binding transcriptional regulator [Arenicella sp. 4NH20-0111]|uniref:LacI family DNA-binding transcriptional regulator n=1 Tax=Arenicella sp. 4NH20-0111 TaxID=3127648 RepID=UPI00310A1647